jgi:hypothetical protein
MTTDTTAFPAPYPWLRLALVVVVALELLDALPRAHNIFTDYHHPTALLRFAQALTSVQLALAPFITAAAFIQALRPLARRNPGAGRARVHDLVVRPTVDPNPRLRVHA